MKVAIVLAFCLLLVAGTALAGVNWEAKAAVHVIPHASRTCTKSFPVITGCEDIITTEPTPDVDAFPVFYDLIEYQGFDYGLTWPGLYSCAFTSCSPLTIGGIVWPGDGISHAWTACQPYSVAVTGWGWIYDYGLICIVPHPEPGNVNVGDCSAELNQACPSCAGIGGYIGDDPCANLTGTESRTWGGVKSLFR